MSIQHAYLKLIETFLLLDDGDHRVLSRHGLTPSQFAALKLLGSGPGLRPIDLTQPLLMEKSSVSRLIDRLVHEQLVDRGSDPDDRRSQRLTLTPKGRDLLERARQAHDQSVVDRLGGLSPAEQAQLSGMLERLTAHLRGMLDRDPSASA